MRIIARSTLRAFGAKHPETKASLDHWESVTRSAEWQSMDDVMRSFPKAKAINAERVRFEVAGGNYRLIAAIDFPRSAVFVKFLGTHAEYDRIDATSVAQF